MGTVNEALRVKELSLIGQLVFILLSAFPFWLGIYWLLPWLTKSGHSLGFALSASLLVPLLLLLIGAIIYGLLESSSGIKGLSERWHLKPMKWSDGAWALFLLVISVIGYLTLAGISNSFNSRLFGITPPNEFSYVHTETYFWGMKLAGNWWALVVHLGILTVNVLGEELWFRGILFPKQKLMFGKQAWLIHGFSYHLWHMFYPWDILRLLPASLAYGWVIQKTGNTWTTIIVHFLFNGIGLIATVSGIIQ